MLTKAEFDSMPACHPDDQIILKDGSILRYKSYGSHIIMVVHISQYDWRAYIHSTNEYNHHDAMETAWRSGVKFVEKDARHHFPRISDWAREVGLPYGG